MYFIIKKVDPMIFSSSHNRIGFATGKFTYANFYVIKNSLSI